MGALVLVPFLQMAGQGNLLIVGVLSMTVADVALDLLNVLVFPNGLFGLGQMFGMGLASSLSYYAALVISGAYFLTKRCVFKFSLKDVSLKKILELFREGLPAGFNMASSVILVLVLNRILQSTGGSDAVAAFAPVLTVGNTANAISTGVGGVALTLSGIFHNEEDRTALHTLIRFLIRYAVVLGLCMGAFLVLAAPFLISLFIPHEGETRDMAVFGLRMFAAGMIPCAITNALKNTWLGTGRVWLTETVSMVEGAFFPAAAAFFLSRFMGVTGAWLYFPAGEWLTLLFLGVLIAVLTRKVPWKGDTALLLKKDFGVAPENLLEMEIHTMHEVTKAAHKAEGFCIRHGHDEKISNHIALCVEEMAANTIQHGFTMDNRHHDLSVRLLHKNAGLVLRFRDDCGAFDPVRYIPKDEEDALGLRLVLAFATDARYTYAMNLNNVCIRIRDEK
jgi:anti-sigma regulatory factor (Ser/Thr protein kinase)